MAHNLSAYDLKSFYNSPKGKIIYEVLEEKLLNIWPAADCNKTNFRVMGYGYSLPYLKPYLNKNCPVFNMMPTRLGVHHWPENQENLVCLSHEGHLPLETNSVDRIIMIHALEFADSPEECFEEIWRVLKSTGRLLIVVPNRLGFWARADWNPFGQGQPYSARQIEKFLSDNLFVHEGTSHALFSPPFETTLLLRAARFFEKIGVWLYPALGGVSVIEASKQLYAGRGKTVSAPSRAMVGKTVTSKIIPTRRVKE